MDFQTLTVTIITGSQIAILLVTLIAILFLRRSSSSYSSIKRHLFYEDADGSATRRSLAKYSDRLPKFSVNGCAVIGLLIALAYTFRVSLTAPPDQGLLLASVIRIPAWVGNAAETYHSTYLHNVCDSSLFLRNAFFYSANRRQLGDMSLVYWSQSPHPCF
jgi:hypothetical protein